MSPILRLNTQSREYTGNTVLQFKKDRGYFFIVMTVGTGTIECGAGGGKIPLATGPTGGGTTVEAGFTVIGFFRSLENKTISLEVAENFAGMLILESVLVEITPLW